MKTLTLFLFIIVVNLFLSPGYASEPPAEPAKRPVNVNFTTGDLKLEVAGLEDTLKVLRDSVETLTLRIEKVSENPNITEDEARLIRELITELNKTAQTATELANSLPQKIKDSQGPIRDIGKEITGQLKSVVFFSILVFVMAIIAIIYFSYLYLFRPIQRVAEKMQTISRSIEKTVDKVAELDSVSNRKYARKLVR